MLRQKPDIKEPEPSSKKQNLHAQTALADRHSATEGKRGQSQQAMCLATEEVGTFKVKDFPLQTAYMTR